MCLRNCIKSWIQNRGNAFSSSLGINYGTGQWSGAITRSLAKKNASLANQRGGIQRDISVDYRVLTSDGSNRNIVNAEDDSKVEVEWRPHENEVSGTWSTDERTSGFMFANADISGCRRTLTSQWIAANSNHIELKGLWRNLKLDLSDRQSCPVRKAVNSSSGTIVGTK